MSKSLENEYFIVKPEVAGGWGHGTIADRETLPPRIIYLDYCFDDWLGDGLVTTAWCCFIVRRELKEELAAGEFSGIHFERMSVSKSELFYDLNSYSFVLPEFVRLVVNGSKEVDDFWIGENFTLVVSSSALAALKKHGLANAEIQPYRRVVAS